MIDKYMMTLTGKIGQNAIFFVGFVSPPRQHQK